MDNNVISSDGAAKTLTDGVNRLIAIVSVVLGVISIYLARQTDKVFAEQKAQQNAFMEHIDGYTRNMSQSIDRLLYDRTSDKSGTKNQNSSEANEDDARTACILVTILMCLILLTQISMLEINDSIVALEAQNKELLTEQESLIVQYNTAFN